MCRVDYSMVREILSLVVLEIKSIRTKMNRHKTIICGSILRLWKGYQKASSCL